MKLSDVESMVSGLDHPEAMAWHRDGSLWAGGEGGQLYQVNPQAKTFVQRATLDAFCLGLLFLDDESLLICDCKNHQLLLWNRATGQSRVFASEVAGEKIHHPNYAVRTAQGEIYVTDSGHWGKADGKIYALNEKGEGTVVARGLNFANGLAWSEQGQMLYLAESGSDQVSAFHRNSSGNLEPKGVVASGLKYIVDGLMLGCEETLYVSCYGNSAVYEVNLKTQTSQLLLEDPTGVVLNRVTNMLIEKERSGRRHLWMSNLGGYHLCRILIND